MAKYAAGQRWAYKTREQDVGSTLVIGNVQKRLLKSPIIHVMLERIVTPNSPEPITVGHMPFAEHAIDASVLSLVESNAGVGPQFEEGLATWKRQKGGVFDLTVSEAVDAMLSVTTQTQNDDPFDDIVTEILAKQSEELIGELYRHLFSLRQWFFLCEPDNDLAPVQWVFPDGMNPTPAILAFTSPHRAASAAVDLGIYPDGTNVSIMPASVEDSVKWISGPECSSDWLCFNLTQKNFPLYVADAVRLLKIK